MQIRFPPSAQSHQCSSQVHTSSRSVTHSHHNRSPQTTFSIRTHQQSHPQTTSTEGDPQTTSTEGDQVVVSSSKATRNLTFNELFADSIFPSFDFAVWGGGGGSEGPLTPRWEGLQQSGDGIDRYIPIPTPSLRFCRIMTTHYRRLHRWNIVQTEKERQRQGASPADFFFFFYNKHKKTARRGTQRGEVCGEEQHSSTSNNYETTAFNHKSTRPIPNRIQSTEENASLVTV